MRYTIRTGTLLAAAAVALMAGIAGCEATAPLPAGAIAITPREYYPLWWSMVENCSGKTRPMSEIDWYIVHGDRFMSSPGESSSGVYYEKAHRIVIADYYAGNGPVVRHEMLHALLRRQSEAEIEHPAEFYLRRCAAFVECAPGCVETSGPLETPPASVDTQPASLLELTVEVDSLVRRSAYTSFVFVPVKVRARNPRTTGIFVDLRRSNGYRMTFDVWLIPPPDVPGRWVFETETYDPMSGYFAPGETKEHVFDLFLPKDGAGYGAWSVTGGFSGVSMKTPITFRYMK